MPAEGLRIWRTPFTDFYKDETLHASENYTTENLRRIAEAGFNAVWIHAIDHDVVRTRRFPELGANSAAHLKSLQTVIRRAAKEGLKVFLYMQPPRGLPGDHPFWKAHPEAKGTLHPYRHHPLYAMCTSDPGVKSYLNEVAETLARKLKGLGGVILITASEYQAHCYTHHNFRGQFVVDRPPSPPLSCARCRERHPSDVAAEVVAIFHDRFAALAPQARVVAWNWSWTLYEDDPGARLIGQLPKGVTLMADFERGGHKVILGKERLIDEYALGYAGPSERFMGVYNAARKRGMRMMAKLQIGTTHELATVPNLPLIGALYDKARGMRGVKVKDFMGSWNFGTMTTANTAAFNRFMTAPRLGAREAELRRFAADYMPGCDAAGVAAAWQTFADAMGFYPFCIPFLYYSASNMALMLPIEPGPLTGKSVGRAWMMDERGDELKDSFGVYTLKEIVEGLAALVKRWREGEDAFLAATAACKGQAAQEERNTVRVVRHCYQSCLNIYRAYDLKKKWTPAKARKLLPILRDELQHLREVAPVLAGDPRQGIHLECQGRMFTAEMVTEKIARLEKMIAKMEK